MLIIMKTVLKYESRVQENLIGLLLILIILAFIFQKIISIILIVDFFLIAIFQYSINIIKFLKKEYPKTISRKVYIFLSTYSVLVFLWLISSKFLDTDFFNAFFSLAIWSLIILPPILIIQSLLISYSDKNLKDEESKYLKDEESNI